MALTVSAQIKNPAPSPLSKLEQVVGVTQFSVEYSRPSVKGREIYGALVPYGEVWRTGANAPTKVSFDSEIEFGDETVPAGEYVLFSIPGPDEWTIILYGDTDVRGAGFYDAANDVARVTVQPVALEQPVETFTIGFDALRDESATFYLDWASTRVPVAIGIDTGALSLASLEAARADLSSWTARDYANASDIYVEQGKDLETATKWMGKAASMNDNAFWWQHSHAKLLAEQGMTEAAIAAAERSLAAAKASKGGDFGYIARNEALLESLKD